jgi:transcriptional regulator with XRE-family HTH domain
MQQAEQRLSFAGEVDATIERGVTPEAIATEFGISPGTVSRWRQGISSPPSASRIEIISRLRLLKP